MLRAARTSLLSLFVIGVMAAQSEAAIILVGFPEFNGPVVTTGFPLPPVTVSTENYVVPAGETVVSASLAGVFGQTSQHVGSTAHFDIYLNGELVGSTFDVTPDPFTNVVPFNFSITAPSLLSSLTSGSAMMELVQRSQTIIRLSESTLTLNTAPAEVPEPASLTLLGLGSLGLMGGALRRRRSAVASKC